MKKTPPKIAVIGAGVAGLSCARRLADTGFQPVIFDKGRGLGGRLSTRRADGGFQFDHGAQYLTAREPEFAEILGQAEAAGAVARWPRGVERPAFVGIPGMTGLARHWGNGLDLRQGIEVTAIRRDHHGWHIAWHGGSETVDCVVLTVPAPQAAALLGTAHPMRDALSAVVIEPCLTLMFALPEDTQRPFETRLDPDNPISWIACDSAKPGRTTKNCFVAQARADWSHQHLEHDRDEIARLMLPLVSEDFAPALTDLRYLSAHRWRYAFTTTTLGEDFLSDEHGTLFVGGDWCLGAKAEHAWKSGTSIADAITRLASA